MKDFQLDFLKLCIENDILLFGEFTLKSGRVSPYFFNAGKFDNGRLLEQLTAGFARLISDNLVKRWYDTLVSKNIYPGIFGSPSEWGRPNSRIPESQLMLYGPAYKGIPLVAATAVNLAHHHNLEISYAYNRKEAKDHGERGITVGADIKGDVVIIDDVITAGTSIYESARIIKQAGATVQAVVIALDRQEIATGKTKSAVQEVGDRLGAPVYSLIQLDTLIEYLEVTEQLRSHAPRIAAYRDQYGLKLSQM